MIKVPSTSPVYNTDNHLLKRPVYLIGIISTSETTGSSLLCYLTYVKPITHHRFPEILDFNAHTLLRTTYQQVLTGLEGYLFTARWHHPAPSSHRTYKKAGLALHKHCSGQPSHIIPHTHNVFRTQKESRARSHPTNTHRAADEQRSQQLRRRGGRAGENICPDRGRPLKGPPCKLVRE